MSARVCWVNKRLLPLSGVGVLGIEHLLARPSWATALPWEAPILDAVASFSGPMAGALGTLAVVGFGFTLAGGEGGGLLRRGLQLICGLTVVFSAGRFVLPWLGYGGI